MELDIGTLVWLFIDLTEQKAFSVSIYHCHGPWWYVDMAMAMAMAIREVEVEGDMPHVRWWKW